MPRNFPSSCFCQLYFFTQRHKAHKVFFYHEEKKNTKVFLTAESAENAEDYFFFTFVQIEKNLFEKRFFLKLFSKNFCGYIANICLYSCLLKTSFTNTSLGVLKPNVFLGLLFKSSWTLSISHSGILLKSVPLG